MFLSLKDDAAHVAVDSRAFTVKIAELLITSPLRR
jgi:hypothetical protein